jgi:predicted amidophosphoribosyltransferase
MSLIKALLNIIYPELCFACRELVPPGEVFCLPCLASIKPTATRMLPLRGRKTLVIHAVGGYGDALRKLVAAKFRYSQPAARAAGKLMAQLLPEEIFDVDYIVPVPLHWWRYASRGYNQAVEMAKAISAATDVPYKPLLMRRRFTKFQYLLSREDRQTNVSSVFALRPGAHAIKPNPRILLIDDLCTTGVTLQEAANALEELKPTSIVAAVCARALS